jgi:hypothetical protein
MNPTRRLEPGQDALGSSPLAGSVDNRHSKISQTGNWPYQGSQVFLAFNRMSFFLVEPHCQEILGAKGGRRLRWNSDKLMSERSIPYLLGIIFPVSIKYRLSFGEKTPVLGLHAADRPRKTHRFAGWIPFGSFLKEQPVLRNGGGLAGGERAEARLLLGDGRRSEEGGEGPAALKIESHNERWSSNIHVPHFKSKPSKS